MLGKHEGVCCFVGPSRVLIGTVLGTAISWGARLLSVGTMGLGTRAHRRAPHEIARAHDLRVEGCLQNAPFFLLQRHRRKSILRSRGKAYNLRRINAGDDAILAVC